MVFREALTEAITAIVLTAGFAAIWVVVQEWIFWRFTDDHS